MSGDDGIHIVKTPQGYEVRHWMGETCQQLLATYSTLDEAIKRGQAERTEYGLSFSLNDEAMRKNCQWCKVRPATLHFGDMFSLTHGGDENCCALCAAEMQLTHAQERAAAIPKLEAEVERLQKELAL